MNRAPTEPRVDGPGYRGYKRTALYLCSSPGGPRALSVASHCLHTANTIPSTRRLFASDALRPPSLVPDGMTAAVFWYCKASGAPFNLVLRQVGVSCLHASFPARSTSGLLPCFPRLRGIRYILCITCLTCPRHRRHQTMPRESCRIARKQRPTINTLA